MATSKSIYIAVAPLALLLITGVGAHFLPILLGDNQTDDDDVPPIISHARTHSPAPRPSQKPAPSVDAKTQAALEKTVSGQIAAFHRNDFRGALSFSTPRFRATVTPDDFRTMISHSYPQLMSAVAQTFQAAHGTKSEAVLPVLVASDDGSVTQYMYILGAENGGWYVTGCSRFGPPPAFEGSEPHPVRPASARI